MKLKKGSLGSVMMTVIAVTLILFAGHAGTGRASDANALLKQVSKELRQAQKDMFAGKTDKAVAALEPIASHLVEIKGVDPNNPRLKTALNKYKKLVKDLERRTGQDLGGGTLTVAGASTQTTLAPLPEGKPLAETQDASSTAKDATAAESGLTQPAQPAKAAAPSKIPHAARRPLRDVTNQLRRIDGYIKRLNDPASTFNKEQLVGNMDKALALARTRLDEARALAAEKGVGAHPDFDKAEADLAAAGQKAVEAKGAYKAARAAAAVSSSEVNADVDALVTSYKQLESLFSKATGYVMHYNDLKPVRELLGQIEDFEENTLDKTKDQLEAFALKYGTTAQQIDQKADSMGYSGQGRASFPYTALSEGIINVGKTRTVMADDLVRRASQMKDQADRGIGDFARLKHYKRIRTWGELAARMDGDNTRVKTFNSGVESWIREDLAALNAKIDRVTWPGHGDNAPDNADKLSRIAIEFLQKEENRRAEKDMEVGRVLAVVVTGPWRVFKKNLLGEPIQYNLPILCAVAYESDATLNVARVYDSTLLTQEYKGVKKAPPFLGATVGNSFFIRPSEIKR